MSHSYTNSIYHVVFSTKYREPLITDDIENRLYRYIDGIARKNNGQLLAIGGTDNHIHLLMRKRGQILLSEVIKNIKGGSSKWMNCLKALPERFAWQKGYGAFSVSQSLTPEIVRYINGQKEHHKKSSFESEFIVLLEKNEVDFDRECLFEIRKVDEPLTHH